jgi:hypothetical protein
MLLTPTRARPWGFALSIAARMAWYIPIMPVWDTLVSRSTRIGPWPALNRGCSATLSSFGSPGVLVAAECRVERVVGQDAGVLGLVADPAHGAPGQRARLDEAQADPRGAQEERGLVEARHVLAP